MESPAIHPDPWSFCQESLVAVSRSFALIIPACPPPLDRAMCVAYLLCRIADTIEDEAELNDQDRALLYHAFMNAVDQPEDPDLSRAFVDAWPEITFSDDGYERLVRNTAAVVAVYRDLPAPIKPPIRTCVHDMMAGMRTVRPIESHHGVQFFCRDLAELDEYCHIVAGTVGIMSTALFEWQLRDSGFKPRPEWREEGRRLGLGLQMTNIIKDCRVDAERGVSFIPTAFVHLDQDGYHLAHSLREMLFTHAIHHLDAGLEYTLVVPVDQSGIRTFLLGSLLPAIATLEVAGHENEHHPKIDRDKMVEIMTLVQDHHADSQAIRQWYTEHRTRTLDAAADVSTRAADGYDLQ